MNQKFQEIFDILSSRQRPGGFMKYSLFTTSLLALLTSSASWSQEMSTTTAINNQCRAQAKAIALQTYQTCLSDDRAAKIEQINQIKQEYQDKIADLKKQYESQISDLKSGTDLSEKKQPLEQVDSVEPTEPNSENDIIPMQIESVQSSDQVKTQDLTLPEPTVILKPRTSTVKSIFKSSKVKKEAPVIVAKKRTPGQKGVKGVAKTLPLKQKNSVDALKKKILIDSTEDSKLIEQELSSAEIPEETSAQ